VAVQSLQQYRAHFSWVDVVRVVSESLGVRFCSILLDLLFFESLFLGTEVDVVVVEVDVDGVEVDVVGVDVDVVEALARAVEVGFLAVVLVFRAVEVLAPAVEVDFVALVVVFRAVEVAGRVVCDVNVSFCVVMRNVDVSKCVEHFHSIARVYVGGFELANKVGF